MRWFASARRAKASAGAATLPAGGDGTRRTVPVATAATLIALLPVAAGVGVLVGRGSDDSGKQVVEALKAVSAKGGAVGVAGAGAVAGTTADASAAAAGGADDASSKDAGATKKVGKVEVGDKQAPVIARGDNGAVARQLAGSKPTAKDVAESKQA